LVKEERNRYIVFKIYSNSDVSKEDLAKDIWRTLLAMYGEYGASKTNFWLIEYDKNTKKGIIRCTHTTVNMMRTVLAFTTKIAETPVIIKTLGISGTIKAAKEKFY